MEGKGHSEICYLTFGQLGTLKNKQTNKQTNKQECGSSLKRVSRFLGFVLQFCNRRMHYSPFRVPLTFSENVLFNLTKIFGTFSLTLIQLGELQIFGKSEEFPILVVLLPSSDTEIVSFPSFYLATSKMQIGVS